MKELGSHAKEMHFELGFAASMTGYDFIYFIGENHVDFEEGMKKSDFKQYKVASDLTESMGQHFMQYIKPGDFISIKGSRGAKTERFVELCEPIGWKNK